MAKKSLFVKNLIYCHFEEIDAVKLVEMFSKSFEYKEIYFYVFFNNLDSLLKHI
jgi:hypothetical protein